MRLKPEDWNSGEHVWLIDIVGEPQTVAGALQAIARGPLKDKDVKLIFQHPDGRSEVQRLHQLLARSQAEAPHEPR